MVLFYSKGGTITVTGQLVSAGSSKQLYNPQCFLQYEDPRAPPPSWNVKLEILMESLNSRLFLFIIGQHGI